MSSLKKTIFALEGLGFLVDLFMQEERWLFYADFFDISAIVPPFRVRFYILP